MFGEKKAGSWITGLFGSLVLGALLGGVALTIFEHGFSEESTKNTAIESASSTVPALSTATTTILLAVDAPKSVSDKLFALDIPSKQVQELETKPGWRWGALLASDLPKLEMKKDGTLFVTGNGWNVPLRTSYGKALDEVHLIGLFDPLDLALSARTDERAIYLVSRVGEIRKLMTLDDTMNPLSIGDGRVWIVTAVPGQGIESPPQGPSTLIRLTKDGSTSTAAMEQGLITSSLAGLREQDGEPLAYTIDSGTSKIVAGSFSWSGDGRPLAWLDAAHVLISRGTNLYLLTIDPHLSDPLSFIVTMPFAPSFASVSSSSIHL